MSSHETPEFRIQIKDLPDSFTEPIFQQIQSYATGLGIDDPERNKLAFIGSGTFIKWNDRFGILTAEHVVRHPTRCDLTINSAEFSKQRVSILLDENQNDFGFQAKDLKIHTTGPRDSNEYGPDLAVIELPPSLELSTLVHKKDFWNISSNIEDKLSLALNESGVMAIAGHPGEDIEKVLPAPGFSEAISVPGLIGFTGQDMYCKRDLYDYIEVRSIRDDTNLAPASYAGVSGGSVWRIPLLKNSPEPEAPLLPVKITLAGVPFFQIRVTFHGENRVRAHGPLSLYRELPKFLPT